MTIWKVNLVDGSQKDLHDVKTIVGEYFELKPEWVSGLQGRIKEFSSYAVHLKLIQLVKGPQAETLNAPFLLSVVTDPGLNVILLGELNEAEGGVILGVWPDQFVTILKKDPQAIMNLLFSITERPDIIARLDIFF